MNSFSLKANRKYPSLPGVGQTVESHVPLLELMSQGMATHERRTKDVLSSFVRVQELIELGVARREGDRIVLSLPTSSSAPGASTLADLIDVDVSGVADGDSLVYDSGSGLWVPAAISGGGGGANITPDTHPAVADSADDEFEDGAVLDTTGGRFSGATAWSWQNQGIATALVGQGALVFTAPASAGNDLRFIRQPISAPGRWRCKVAVNAMNDSNWAGMGLINSGSTAVFSINAQNATGISGALIHAVQKWAAPGTIIGTPYAAADTARFGAVHQWVYFEVEWDGTNVYARISGSGVEGTFVTLYSEAAVAFMGVPDYIALICNAGGTASDAVAVFDWFRRFA